MNKQLIVYLFFILIGLSACEQQPPASSTDSQGHSAMPSFLKTSWQMQHSSADEEDENANLAEKDTNFSYLWEQITPKLTEVLTLEEKQQTLPESSWFFGETQKTNQNKINQLLDEAVGMLAQSESTDIRAQIRQLEQYILETRNTIADYRQAQVSAPHESSWKTTVSDYEQKIDRLKDKIAETEAKIETYKKKFAKSLHSIGLYLSKQQIDILLSSVVGNEIIQATVVYDNVKKINQQLMKLTTQSEEELSISKRYYGMYTVLLKILLHMQETFIGQIDDYYLPKINEIIANIHQIKQETAALLINEVKEKRKSYLLANQQAQELTLKTAHLYQQHLENQRQKMWTARDKTLADLKVAKNTYQTVTISNELVGLLRNSQKSFELLMSMQTPALLAFENLQMKKEFAELTRQLQ